MSDHETTHQSTHATKETEGGGGGMSMAPPAFSLSAAPPSPPAQLAANDSRVVQRQEDPDAAAATAETGTLSEISFLRTNDLSTRQQHEGQNLFFREGDTVTFVQNSSTNAAWIEVSGTAYYGDRNNPTSAGTMNGWIQRAWTSMQRGNYQDLHVDNRTSEYGDLGTGQVINPDNVILHQTMTRNGQQVLDEYTRRIGRGSSIGAQYLIDENGAIILVTPANEKTSHAVGNKNKAVTRVTAEPGTPEFTAQMQTVRQEIEDYYTELTSVSIPADQRDALLILDDETLFSVLQGQNWMIYSSISNSTSVGIEVVGYPEQIYDPASAPPFSREVAESIRTEIQGMDLAPEFKAQLLQTEARAEIEANTTLTDEARTAQLEQLDRELYQLLRDYEWYIYVDISAEQKYASWMLVQALCEDFGIPIDTNVVGHNQVSRKTLGEGENNMEFTRTMIEFQARLATVTANLQTRGIPLTGDLQFLADWQAKVASMDTGNRLQEGEEGYPEMIAFFENFWTYSAELTAVETILNNAEGVAQEDLVTQIGAAHSG